MNILWFHKVEPELDEPAFDKSPEHPSPFTISAKLDVLKNHTFQFYNIFTNFAVSDLFLSQLSKIEGVETITPLTRYRITACVSDYFSPATILASIRSRLVEPENSLLNLDKLSSLSEGFQARVNDFIELSKGKYKSAYIFPNGKMEYWSGNYPDTVFRNKCKLFSSMKNKFGGNFVVFTGGECNDSLTEQTETESFV